MALVQAERIMANITAPAASTTKNGPKAGSPLGRSLLIDDRKGYRGAFSRSITSDSART